LSACRQVAYWLLVGFSDDRRVFVLGLVVVFVFGIVIIVIRDPRRHHVGRVDPAKRKRSRECVRSYRLLSDVGRPAAAAGWASALAAATKHSHKGRMSKTRVEFKYKRIAEDEWQIEAHYPGAELRHIKGFTSKAEIDEWLQGSRRIDWLRSQGYAK
jgi:hypothetical protein